MRDDLKIGYVVAPSANQIAIAVWTTGVAWTTPMVVVLVALVGLGTTAYSWTLILLAVAVELVMFPARLHDLLRFRREPEWYVPPGRYVASLMGSTVSAALIAYGLGGPTWFWLLAPVLLVSPVCAAATSNTIGVVLTVVWSSIALLTCCVAASLGPRLTIVAVVSYTGVLIGIVLVMREIVQAGLRAADRFDRLTETFDVILRAEGFESSLAGFLPLAAAQLRADRIDVFAVPVRGDASRLVSWPTTDGPKQPRALPEGDERTGSELRPDGAVVWASQEGRLIVLDVAGDFSSGRHRLSFQTAARQLSQALQLLLLHASFLTHLESLGRTDPLTGLANRLQLVDHIAHECNVARRRFEPLTVAMIDIDHFKAYNDEHGHLEGDRALVLFSSLLQQRVRGTDYAFRYGGEEFCLLLPNTPATEAACVVDEMRALTEALPTRRTLSFSAGVITWNGTDDAEGLLRRADNALYTAKSDGRARTVVAPSEPTDLPRTAHHR